MIGRIRRWSLACAVALAGCTAEPDHISLLGDLGPREDGGAVDSGGPSTRDAQAEGSALPQCTGDGDCGVPFPYCDTSVGVCVECLGDPNCVVGTCELSTHRCVENCTTGTVCTEGYCDPSSGRCVECTTSGDCLSLEEPLCNTTLGECVECLTNAECATALCLASRGECAHCRVDTDCETGQTCDLTTFECQG